MYSTYICVYMYIYVCSLGFLRKYIYIYMYSTYISIYVYRYICTSMCVFIRFSHISYCSFLVARPVIRRWSPPRFVSKEKDLVIGFIVLKVHETHTVKTRRMLQIYMNSYPHNCHLLCRGYAAFVVHEVLPFLAAGIIISAFGT